MSDFLTRLALRATDTAAAVRPRPLGRFETAAEPRAPAGFDSGDAPPGPWPAPPRQSDDAQGGHGGGKLDAPTTGRTVGHGVDVRAEEGGVEIEQGHVAVADAERRPGIRRRGRRGGGQQQQGARRRRLIQPHFPGVQQIDGRQGHNDNYPCGSTNIGSVGSVTS